MGGAVVARVAEQPEPVDTFATRTDAAPADATKVAARPDHVVAPVADPRVFDPLQRRMRWIFGIAAALVAALVVSLTLRPLCSYVNLVDGWGEAAFELSMGGLCVARFYEASWRTSTSVARLFPLIVGMACLAWGLGDAVLALKSVGGVQPPTPSPADAFYVCFFPISFLGLALLIRRGNRSSLMATSLDGLVAGFGVAAISAAVLVAAIADMTGGSPLATATNLAYPLGDVLLLALAVGGFAVLPQGFRPFFAIVCLALALNAFANFFSLLEPMSRFGYVSHGAAWPLSLALVALAVWVLPSTLENPGTDKMAGFGLPAVGAAIGVTILFVGSFGHMGKPAIALATVTLLVAGVRLGLTVREAHSLKTARFRSLIDKTWDLIAVVESDLRIAYVTPSSTRVLGYPAGTLEGTSFTGLVHPDDSHTVIAHLTGLNGVTGLSSGTSGATTFEVRMRHASGEYRLINWNAADLLADPSVNGYVLNGGDVTETRQAAKDLVAAHDAALVASKAKSQFVSMMSHEIRTPMNGVIGLTELLLQTPLSEEQEELAAGVKVSAESLLVIVNDILDFSKIEAGKLDIEESEFHIADVVGDVGRILAGTAHGKGVELLIDIEPDIPDALLGDGARIRQVLLNFGANAVKFTADGEVVIRVAVLHQNAERVALHFDVVDTGIGIAPQEQQRLFTAFTQADSSTTRRFGGTGLGLTISRQLVELMGGRLGLTSAPGQGSTFWFELSLRRADNVTASVRNADPRTLSGQRALVIDDNATNRRILRQQLLSWGVEAVEADSGLQALELAAEAAREGRAFDLGIVDLNMPGIDGIEVARRLKADAATGSTTLFLLSSSGYHSEAAESHLNGFAASLTKPVRSSDLFDCLVTTLDSGLTLETLEVSEPAKASVREPRGLIMLVEDNRVNQLVGSKVLQNLGYDFAIATNGLEAVAAFRTTRFDAVLMDCQMPEMDGFEATGAIRYLEEFSAWGHVPIIAMTAAAMEGDRERCIAAGMDDFITKPVRLEVVSAVLERWVEKRKTGSCRREEQGIDRGGDPLDRVQIALLLSLDDGQGGALAEIIGEFLSMSARGLAELDDLLTQGDRSGLERAAHTLKGASVNVGARGLAEVCAGLERHAHEARLQDASGLMHQFDAELARVRGALEIVTARV